MAGVIWRRIVLQRVVSGLGYRRQVCVGVCGCVRVCAGVCGCNLGEECIAK